MVIQKNPDENVNHLPSAAPCVVEGVNATAASTDIIESNRRYLIFFKTALNVAVFY